MNLYDLIRQCLFQFEPERAHSIALRALSCYPGWMWPKIPSNPVNIAGLTFSNRIGLAAGLDKNGDYIDALGHLGFGFIEVGTVTPKPQMGNPKPRLFRLPRSQALINRMGFNNKGVDHLVEQIKQRKYQGILGVNIGKNALTPLENAASDYVTCLEKVFPYCDYIAVNISSPNTQGLRSLQHTGLEDLLTQLCKAQEKCYLHAAKSCPLFVKVAPDLTETELTVFAEMISQFPIQGVIATNTTLSREGVDAAEQGIAVAEQGGLSGKPLLQKSTEILPIIRSGLREDQAIIGVGGIFSGQDALNKLQSGADLVAIYSGFIYKGWPLLHNIAKTIEKFTIDE